MHRDISPKNLLVLSLNDSAPRAVICDFGISTEAAISRRKYLGPPPFVAPEVWRGQGVSNILSFPLLPIRTPETCPLQKAARAVMKYWALVSVTPFL